MESAKLDEEKLREAACYGDLDAVRSLVSKGVNVNSQHSINGWTALHWAAKRNQLDVAHFLMSNGANKDVESFAKELPADLATSPAVLNLLGSTKTKTKTEDQEKSCFIPHYLSQPDVGYKVALEEPPRISDTQHKKSENSESFKQSRELVFKLRIAYTTDPDFIEVEMDRSELTYAHLMSVCCSELGLNSKYVDRLRKLPNTRLRKDRDVQRLRDFEEIEVVLVGSKPNKISAETEPSRMVSPTIKNHTILY